MDDADEDLTRLAIAQALEIDHQYLEAVETWDQPRIDLIRRLGRAVARERGWKVRTGVVERDTRVTVWVVIAEGDPEDEARIHERSMHLLERAFQPPPD